LHNVKWDLDITVREEDGSKRLCCSDGVLSPSGGYRDEEGD
jgi:hypothetical protein